MKIMTTKELKKFLPKHGWELVRQSNHLVYHCPCGDHRLTIPKTSKSWDGARNRMGTLRRDACPSLQGVL